jgi:hypothetical protein
MCLLPHHQYFNEEIPVNIPVEIEDEYERLVGRFKKSKL